MNFNAVKVFIHNIIIYNFKINILIKDVVEREALDLLDSCYPSNGGGKSWVRNSPGWLSILYKVFNLATLGMNHVLGQVDICCIPGTSLNKLEL